MALILDWLPWIAIALVPGILNVVVTRKQLDKQFRYYYLLRPSRSFGVWIWCFIQLTTPAVAFWLLQDLSSKPSFSLSFVGWAIAFGFAFTAVLNAYIDTGAFQFDIKTIYKSVLDIAYTQIEAEQTGRNARFWSLLLKELTSVGDDEFIRGLKYLRQYYLIAPQENHTEEERQELHELIHKLDEIEQRQGEFVDRTAQSKGVRSVMMVRREDMPTVLAEFGCYDTLQQYFPRQAKELLLPPSSTP